MIQIFGLYAMNEMPVMEMLGRTQNKEHINLIELARTKFLYHAQRGRVYDGIMVVIGCDAARVYDFK